MYPPLVEVLRASAAVTSIIGSAPIRCYLAGEAPQGVARPYVVWMMVGGAPENFLDRVPDADNFRLQIDAYANTAHGVRELARALRDAIERHCHIVSWNGDGRDPETNLYGYSFDVSWFVRR